MTWEILRLPEVYDWELWLTPGNQTRVKRAFMLLRSHGPNLGRPHVDHLKGSAIRNLKELRIRGEGGSEFRMLFLFDGSRKAIVLVAGDKKGEWKKWYQKQIPVAEQRYLRYLKNLQ
jgi:hypothetical protein